MGRAFIPSGCYKVWNGLPCFIQAALTMQSFQRSAKTHLFYFEFLPFLCTCTENFFLNYLILFSIYHGQCTYNIKLVVYLFWSKSRVCLPGGNQRYRRNLYIKPAKGRHGKWSLYTGLFRTGLNEKPYSRENKKCGLSIQMVAKAVWLYHCYSCRHDFKATGFII